MIIKKIIQYKNKISYEKILICILLLGILLRVVEYGAQKSFWLDEARIANLVLHVPLSKILQLQLSDFQIIHTYPAGFILITKILVKFIGNHELAFRLFPFLCGLGSLFLFYRIGILITAPSVALLAFGFFSISRDLIHYSATLKPYSSDIFITLGIFWAVLKIFFDKISNKFLLVLVFLLGFSVWFSFSAIFVLGGTCGALIFHYLTQRGFKKAKQSLIIVVWSTVSFLIYYHLSIKYFYKNNGLIDFWETAYMPNPYFFFSFVQWLVVIVNRFFYENFQYPASLVSLLFLIGSTSFFLKKREVFCLLVPAILLTFISSGLKLYPFRARLVLFLAPAIFLLIAEGIECIKNNQNLIIGKLSKGVVVILLIFYPVLFTYKQFIEPFGHEEIKPALEYLQKHRQNNEIIYVYYGAAQAFLYYAPKYGFKKEDYWIGNSSRNDPLKYLKDIQEMQKFDRVWLIFSHVHINEDINERKFFLNALNQDSVLLKRFELKVTPHSSPFLSENNIAGSVYLYDIKN